MSVFDTYPMPRVDALIHKVGGATCLSTIDLTKGYWQIPLDVNSKAQTAFSAPSGLYQFTKMPFGLHHAAASFQRLMDHTLWGLQDCAVGYIDNILIFSHSWKEHLIHLRRVLCTLRQAGLVTNRRKSRLGCSAIQYLGFNIGGRKVWPIQHKVEVLEKAAPLTTRRKLQSFLGLANYYRFVVNFTTQAAPLTDLLKGGGKGYKDIHLNPLVLEAFQDLKKALCDQTRLHTLLPNIPLMVHTDVSGTGLGTVLSQEASQGQRPIYYLSCKLTPTEHKYAVIEKKALAVRWAINQLKHYLWGQEFTIITDHAPLQWLAQMKDTNPG